MRSYPAIMGLIGREDVHPGGAAASWELIRGLGDPPPDGVIVELGAGAGGTTRRLVARGWRVIAVEPDPQLRGVLQRHGAGRDGGVAVVEGRAETLHHVVGEGAAHAVIAESVLYVTDLGPAFRSIHRTLAPGGLLAFVDAVWSPGVGIRQAQEWHDRSVETYGFAIATRAPWAWDDWRWVVEQAGFDIVIERRLGFGTQGHASRPHLRRAVPAVLREPSLLVDVARIAWRTRTHPRLPAEALETWLCIARKRG